MAIGNEDDCDPPDESIGYPGNCGIYPAAVAYIVLYLVLSFLVIVNMYIAVILENYTQVSISDKCLETSNLELSRFFGHE